MLNVKSTIYKSITNGIDRLRKLADNNPVRFKKILYLIILDDLFDWADYLDEPQSVQKKLKDMRINYINQNSDFIRCYDKSENCVYTNVNTPQSNSTWRRIWDSDYLLVTKTVIPMDEFYTEDSVCESKTLPIPYEKDGKLVVWEEDGVIKLDASLLDNCERLWLYTFDTSVYKFDQQTGEPEEVTMNISDEDRERIIKEVKDSIFISVERTDNGDDKVQFTLADTKSDNELDIMDESEIEDIL